MIGTIVAIITAFAVTFIFFNPDKIKSKKEV